MMRALVVDDHQENLYLLRALLGASGYEVDSAANGREALELAARHPPDIAISDILMPVMDGFTLCRMWRRDPALAPIPFVFYTGTYTDPEDERLALSLGADLFIVKPAEPDAFLEQISGVLERQRRGELKPEAQPAVSDESPYLREYSAALVRKLEAKLGELEEANRRLALKASMIDSALSGISLYDAAGQCIHANPSYAALRGVPREQLIGSRFEALVTDPNALGVILRSLRERGVWIGDFEVKRADGSALTLASVVQRLHDPEGRTAYTMVSCIDVTQQRRAALELQRAERLEALSLFSRGIAHDFNNLLSGFFGNVDLARRLLPDASSAGEYLDNALRAFERARALTARLLTFARGNAPEKGEVNLSDLVHECCALSLSGSAIACDVTPAGDLWTAAGDSSQLSQVCNNIIINAREAMDGSGLLRITLRNRVLAEGELPQLAAGEYVEVSFLDQGPGVPEGALESVFDPTYTTRLRGSGLGLASSATIVKEHGGTLAVRSAPGGGAQFDLLLPRARTARSASAPEVRPASLHGSGRILVMDDEPLVSETVRGILRAAGYDVVEVRDGNLALEACEREVAHGSAFCLAILDVTVRGGMGGLDTMRAMKRRWPELPVLLTSGYSDEHVSRTSDRPGVDFIEKPYRAQELLRRVKTLVSGPR